MAPNKSFELSRADLQTCVGSLADRLRIQAHSLRGMAGREGDVGSAESRTKFEMAGELEAVAEYLDQLRTGLCPSCRTIEVTERVSIEAEPFRT